MKTLQIESTFKTKIQKIKRIILYIIVFVAFCAIMQMIIDNTIGRFPNLYDAIAFNNDIKPDEIVDIIYGEKTATVMYGNGYGVSMQRYHCENGLWVFTGGKPYEEETEEINILIYKTTKGGEWSVMIMIDGDKMDAPDEISDPNSTRFLEIPAKDRWRRYFAYIKPDGSTYTIQVNGETFAIDLSPKFFKLF